MRLTVVAPLLHAVFGTPFAKDDPGRVEQVASATVLIPEGVDSRVERLMASRRVSGVSVAVVIEETVDQLSSVTKSLTATVIRMLVHGGELSLDDKITERWHKLPSSRSNVTVRHLLSHTSGIKRYTAFEGFSGASRKDYRRGEIIDWWRRSRWTTIRASGGLKRARGHGSIQEAENVSGR